MEKVTPQIIPYLYYDDAGRAIEFMQRVFGFEIEQAFRDPKTDRVLHATVRTGSGVIFVGPGMEAFGTHATPDPDWVTSLAYVFVDGIEEHYRRVMASDATLRADLHVHFGGNKQYTVSDPFGQRRVFAGARGRRNLIKKWKLNAGNVALTYVPAARMESTPLASR